jgi:hypothetical protein
VQQLLNTSVAVEDGADFNFQNLSKDTSTQINTILSREELKALKVMCREHTRQLASILKSASSLRTDKEMSILMKEGTIARNNTLQTWVTQKCNDKRAREES